MHRNRPANLHSGLGLTGISYYPSVMAKITIQYTTLRGNAKILTKEYKSIKERQSIISKVISSGGSIVQVFG